MRIPKRTRLLECHPAATEVHGAVRVDIGEFASPFSVVMGEHGPELREREPRRTTVSGPIRYGPTMFEAALMATRLFELHGDGELGKYPFDVDRIVAVLGGRDLACTCPLDDGFGQRWWCHADVLLRVANPAIEFPWMAEEDDDDA